MAKHMMVYKHTVNSDVIILKDVGVQIQQSEHERRFSLKDYFKREINVYTFSAAAAPVCWGPVCRILVHKTMGVQIENTTQNVLDRACVWFVCSGEF